jgi:hypothetical protein
MLRLSVLAGLLCVLAGPAFAIDDNVVARPLDSRLKGTPADIAALAERESSCSRWAKLEISNEATDARSQRAFVYHRCDTLTVDMAALRLKYAQSPADLQDLDAAGTGDR